MPANGQTHTSTATPRTPSRPTAPDDQEPTPPSSDTLTEKKDSFSNTIDVDTPAPKYPFLAYARRVRSFSSPLKINRARYLLTFVDADAAKDWWKLMQEEYPDSVRESNQLYSFKSDRVPVRAWENPRLAHLKDKWTYRQLDDKENQPNEADIPDRTQLGQRRPGKRGSLMRMLSTPALGSIGERPQSRDMHHHSPTHLPEDPFTAPTPPPSEKENSLDMVGLNSTLDRMQMMMNQTNLRIDALAERQQMYADSMDRLQQALESTMMQMQSLSAQYSAGGISTKNMRSAIETNASHVRTVLERQASDSDHIKNVSYRMEEGFRRLDGLAETQRVSLLEIQDTKLSTRQMADRMQTILDRQHAGDGKLDRIMSSLEQAADSHRLTNLERSTSTPSAGAVQRLQSAIEQQQTQLQGLISSQKASNKIVSKMQTSVDSVPSSQADTTRRIEQSQADATRRIEESYAAATKRMEEMQAVHAKEMTKLRRDMNKALDERVNTIQTSHTDQMAKMQASHTGQLAKILKTLDAKTSPVVVQCDHDVAPAPRKMNRELAGYWYKRP